MANVFKIGEDWDMAPPPPGFPKCGNYNGKRSFSFSPSEDFESHEYGHSGLYRENYLHSRINMSSAINKVHILIYIHLVVTLRCIS